MNELELNNLNSIRNMSPLDSIGDSPYTNDPYTQNISNPYLNNSCESCSEPTTCSRVNETTSTDDMKFVPFKFDYNYNQSLNDKTSSYMEDMIQNINSVLKVDITSMPFIPNPYYMMNMNPIASPNSMESTNENQRQKGSFKKGYGYHPGHGYNFHPGFYPYPNPNFYPQYPVPPYPYYSPYGLPLNPLTLLLLSSMHR